MTADIFLFTKSYFMYLLAPRGKKGKNPFSSPKNASEKPELGQFWGSFKLCLNKPEKHSFSKNITQTQFKVKIRTDKSRIYSKHVTVKCFSSRKSKKIVFSIAMAEFPLLPLSFVHFLFFNLLCFHKAQPLGKQFTNRRSNSAGISISLNVHSYI